MLNKDLSYFWDLLGHKDKGWTELRAIPRDKTFPPKSFYVRNYKDFEDQVNKYSQLEGYDVYAGINPRAMSVSGNLNNIAYLCNLVLDLDNVKDKKVLNLFPNNPIVSSGNGFHIYFPLDPILLDDSNRVLVTEKSKSFVDSWRSVIGDKAKVDHVFDLPRVMRIPSTVNRKNGAIATFHQEGELKEYKLEELVKVEPKAVEQFPTYNVIESFEKLLNENENLRKVLKKKFPSSSERVFAFVKEIAPYGYNDSEIQEIIIHYKIRDNGKGSVKDVSRIIEKVRKEISLKPANLFWNYYISSLGKRTLGYSYGIKRIDELTGGLRKGEAILLGAESGVGKTTMVMNFVQSFLKQNVSVLMFGTEMSFEALMDKLVALETNVDLKGIRDNTLSDGEKLKIRKLEATVKNYKFYVSDIGSPSYVEVEREIKKVKPDIVVFDFIQMVDEGEGDTRARILDLFSKNLKILAVKMGFGLAINSQLNDFGLLRDSRAIKHPIEVSAIIKSWGADEDGNNRLELVFDKNRYGALGKVRLLMDATSGRIVEAD